MGQTEKICGCIDLRTGGLIWGYTCIFLSVATMCYIVNIWWSDGTMGTREVFGFACVFFAALIFAIVYARFVHGINQNKPTLMSTAIPVTFGLMVSHLISFVRCLAKDLENVANMFLLLAGIFCYGGAISHKLHKKMKAEEAAKNTNVVNAVEYHVDTTTAQPQSPKAEQV